MTDGIVELAPGRLYALGGPVEVDGRISWLPSELRGYQPLNCFLLIEGRKALLVDTGVPLLGELILKQLSTLVRPGSPLTIFLTRAELECMGNLGAVSGAYSVRRMYSGGGANPFDAFDYANDFQRGRKVQLLRKPKGYAVPLGTSRKLVVITPRLRLLATFWAYDTGTGTLFTSDSFGLTMIRDAAGPRVLDTMRSDDTVGALRNTLFAKFGWLKAANTTTLRADLAEIFSEHQVERIAPSHGCILQERAVSGHYQALMEILEQCAPKERRKTDVPAERGAAT
jgi:flavorubredoxin